jgi:hypothetical protein
VRDIERRSGMERRQSGLTAYWRGALQPRRRAGRRIEDQQYPVVDWHSPRVWFVVLAILGLCVLDGVLTVMLIAHGAEEANPFMAKFVPHQLGWFAAIKLGLTATGVFVLVACSRMRLFRSALRGEALLYVVLGVYAALIAYELRLLELMPDASALA